jgi:hypothetical protein
MRSRTALNIGIAVLVLALGVFIYFSAQEGDPGSSQERHALIPERAENLTRIEIERTGQNAIVLERSVGSPWRMTAPRSARLEEVQLSRVLDVARFRATQRMSADDLARFELDKPWAQIRFNRHAVDFGATNALTQELYVRSGEHVYAVSPRLAAAVPGHPSKLLAHRVFAPDEEPIAIELKDFSVRHDGVRWVLTPHDPNLSQDDLIRWVEQWRLASSVATQPDGQAQAAESIKVELRNGRAVVLGVLERAPNLVLLRDDETLQYHLPSDRAATLLSAPNATGARKP